MNFFQTLLQQQQPCEKAPEKQDPKQHTNPNDTEPFHALHQNVKVGNFIKVVKREKSSLNIYKGYIGEIKDYRRGQNTALVCLHALHSNKLISMPLDHFILIP